MSKASLALCTILLLALSYIGFSATRAPAQPPAAKLQPSAAELQRRAVQQWAYHTENIPSDKELKRLGSEGWEIAAAVAIGDEGNHKVFFKRPLLYVD